MNEEKKELLDKLNLLNDEYLESLELLKEIENPSVSCSTKLMTEPQKPILGNKLNSDQVVYPESRGTKEGVYTIILVLLVIALFILMLYTLAEKLKLYIFIIEFLAMAALIVVIIMIPIKYKKSDTYKQLLRKYRLEKEKIEEYNEKVTREYEEKNKQYLIELDQYQESIKQYDIELEQLKKEKANKIRLEQYEPLVEKMEADNDGLIGEKYYPELPEIIDLIESGRADTLKEALNLKYEMEYKERQLQLEKEKIVQEEADRRETMRRQEEAARRAAYEQQEAQRNNDRQQQEAAQNLCRNCYYNQLFGSESCHMTKGVNPNCPGFRHR